MRGVQKIRVIGNHIEYNLTLFRNITIIRGNSGTGKTTLCKLITLSDKSGGSKFHKLYYDKPLLVAPSAWNVALRMLKSSDNCVILFDEDCEYVKTKEFAQTISNTTNYYVIINRETLRNIPYSVNEIYEFNTVMVGNTYTVSLSPMFKNSLMYQTFNCVITEDSNSGRDMLKAIFDKVLDTAGGNSSVYSELEKLEKDAIPLVVVDGAAFGPYISDIYKDFIKTHSCSIWIPESFEYLLLLSKIVWRKDVDTILGNPSEQISSELFLTWERFFTWLVTDIMEPHPGRYYSKHKLPDWYFELQNIEKLISVLPNELKEHVKK